MRINELESLIIKAYNDAITNKGSVYLGLLLRDVLDNLLRNPEICPYKMSVNWSNGNFTILIKPAKSNTVLATVKAIVNPTGTLEPVTVEGNPRIINSLQSLVDYLTERGSKLESQINKKAEPFRQQLNNLNITVKDYIQLVGDFEHLDAETRRLLYKEGKI